MPGKYAPPRGALLLATQEGSPAGCVALREIDAHSCEMKRMFVYPHLHGKGVGRALAQAVIEEARVLGYRSMLLDTSIRQDEAKSKPAGETPALTGRSTKTIASERRRSAVGVVS